MESQDPRAQRARQPIAVERPLLRVPRRLGGKFTLTVMVAAQAARDGKVVDLHSRDGMVAVTWSSAGGYELTSESLIDPAWKTRAGDVLAQIAEGDRG